MSEVSSDRPDRDLIYLCQVAVRGESDEPQWETQQGGTLSSANAWRRQVAPLWRKRGYRTRVVLCSYLVDTANKTARLLVDDPDLAWMVDAYYLDEHARREIADDSKADREAADLPGLPDEPEAGA